MGSRVYHAFKDGALALLRGGWANRVARRVSYWANGTGMACVFPDNPDAQNPQLIALDVKAATNLIYQQMLENGQLSDEVAAYTLKPIKDENGTLKVTAIYLPFGTTVYIGGTQYTITTELKTLDEYCETGSGVTQFPHWYVITGRTTGDFWLNNGTTDETLTNLTLDSAKSGTSKVTYFIGNVAAGGLVSQSINKAGGKTELRDEASVSQEVGTNAKINKAEGTTKDTGDSSFDSSEVPTDDSAPSATFDPKGATSKWDIGDKDTTVTPNVEVGVRFRVITRSLYDENDGITYMYYRELTFSKAGILVKVGAESRIAVMA